MRDVTASKSGQLKKITIMTEKTRNNIIYAVVFVFSFWSISIFRMRLLANSIGNYTGCTDRCYNWHIILSNDALVFAALLFFIALASISPRCLRVFISLLAALLVLAFGGDVFVQKLLNHRLQIADIFRLGGEIKLNTTVALPAFRSFSSLFLLFSTLLCIFCACACILKVRFCLKNVLLLLVFSLCVGSLRALPQDNHINAVRYKDIISSNTPQSENKPYSSEAVAYYKKMQPLSEVCFYNPDSINLRPVIVLVVESLSLYQSQYLSGVQNYLPEVDRIAKKYASLSNFYANGFTTDAGLIALFTSYIPLPNINRYNSASVYMGFEDPRHHFFDHLHRAGMPTFYFRSADLGFLETGHWLHNIGFEYVEGPEASFYSAMPRGSFSDPGDHALYARFLHWFDHERPSGTFFSVIQTTTTHPPFVVPGADLHGEKAAFEYADREIGLFVQQLEARHFFDQEGGLLFITGDHRTMTAPMPNEFDHVGADFYARVPAIVLSREHLGVGVIPGHWQQTDLIPSVLAFLGLPSCISDLDGRFLGPQRTSARYILHADGAERSRITVRIEGQEKPFYIQLNAEKTDWTGSPPPLSASDSHALLEEINRQRAIRPAAPDNLAASLLQLYGLKK